MVAFYIRERAVSGYLFPVSGNGKTVGDSEVEKLRSMILETSWIPEEEKKKIYLAAEEIFVNICHYAYNGREEGTEGHR